MLAVVQAIIARIGAAVLQRDGQGSAAMDSTGLATSGASAGYASRRGVRCRSQVKLSVRVLCGSLFPLAVVLDHGPGNDRVQVPELLAPVGRPGQLLADAGDDAEWIQAHCREQWGVESLIAPIQRRADGTRGGRWRAQMSADHLKAHG